MTFSAYTLRPSFRAALITFLVHRNPFYLLSALSMLAGCYALNSGLAARTGDLSKLLVLLGVLNFYEMLLIGLGLYLIRKRQILRDGRTLLLLEAPFLVDLTFLNSEIGATSPFAGWLLGLLVLTLALIKMALVLYALWGRIPRRLFAYVCTELAVLLCMPCVFAAFERSGHITMAQFYGAWWIVGLLMAAYELQSRVFNADAEPRDTGLRLFIRRLYIVLPLASIVLHLSLLHWVHRVPFVMGNLAPLLLGGAIAMGRFPRLDSYMVRFCRIAMPLVALLLTLQAPPLWQLHLTTRFDLMPAGLILASVYVTYVYCFFLRWAMRLLAVASGAVLLMLFGPTLGQIDSATVWTRDRATDGVDWLSARSAVEWGIAAIGSAFVFLIVGASLSLRKEPPPSSVEAVT